MLKKDLPTEDYNRLKENTLLKVIRECLEKKYIFCLNFLEKGENLDDVLIVCQLAHGHYKIRTISLNAQLRNVIIEEEKETKKYLKRNDFNVLKGFRQFLVELDTYLKIKLNKKFMKYTLEEMLETGEIDENLELRMDGIGRKIKTKSMNSSKKKRLNLCLTKKTKFYLIFQTKLFPSS